MLAPSLILGTAGHIDHGKSALVKALTGTDPDRLAEEKSRGMTIELGFAQLTLPSGRVMGVVDVPGHERFVRHMVSGATGIDVVLLVIAADDGVMPQTREHLTILELLGVSRGVVAITKRDLVDEEWLELVKADIAELLATTALAGAPIVAVSSRTGEGLDELRAAIDTVAEQHEATRERAPFRLPIDRVFTITGSGTVVTGTMWSGLLHADDPVELFPAGLLGRVRAVQVHGEAVAEARAGQRVAVNIAGIGKDEIARGDVLAAPHSLSPTDRWDAWFTYVGAPGADAPFESGSLVHVHHGTSEGVGRVLLANGLGALPPGASTFAQIRLEERMSPRYGDRFIVRSFSPVRTIGGGVVLNAAPPRRTNLDDAETRLLTALRDGDFASAAEGLVAVARQPIAAEQIASALGIPVADVVKALQRRDIAQIEAAGRELYLARAALESYLAAIDRELRAFHAENPQAADIATAALRDRVDKRLTAPVFDALLALAEARGMAKVSAGRVSHPEAAITAKAAEDEAAERLLSSIRAQGVTPASADQLIAESGIQRDVARKVLGRLVQSGQVVRIASDLHFSAEAIAELRGKVVAFLETHAEATAAELRDAMGVSRKYAIPLLEYFDAEGVTRRVGDSRTLGRSRR